MSQDSTPAEFDRYALDYETTLARGLSASGESADYFAQRRIEWVSARLAKERATVRSILDFGCGVGASAPRLRSVFGAERVVGVDVSSSEIELAKRERGAPQVAFELLARYSPEAEFDLAYCNGVFHHIAPSERSKALGWIYRALRPGGWFAFWENNPWNPGTRYVMSRIPFDRDAQTLNVLAARTLLVRSGFVPERASFLFIFPRMLRFLRGLEPLLSPTPLGGRYLLLCRKQ